MPTPHASHSTSSILGIGNLYFTVILFTLLLSTHILQVPSFLGTSKVGTAHGLRLSLTIPLSNSSLICLCSCSVSLEFVLYAGLLGKGAPGIRLIWCSIPL